MMFGLHDGRTYSSFDGKKGRYTYDMASGLLTMDDGPLAGIKYQRVGDPSLTPAVRMLDQKGQVTAYMCPKQGTKDPNKHPR